MKERHFVVIYYNMLHYKFPMTEIAYAMHKLADTTAIQADNEKSAYEFLINLFLINEFLINL